MPKYVEVMSLAGKIIHVDFDETRRFMPKLGKLAAIHLFGALEVLLTGRLIDPLTGALPHLPFRPMIWELRLGPAHDFWFIAYTYSIGGGGLGGRTRYQQIAGSDARLILETSGYDLASVTPPPATERKVTPKAPALDPVGTTGGKQAPESPADRPDLETLDQEETAPINIDNESRELILVGDAYAIAGEAGQIYRGYTNSDHGIDGEIEFKDYEGKASGKKVYLQLKSGDSYLTTRKTDGSEVFPIKNPRHADYWQQHAYPVMLVIRTSDGVIRWMDVSAYLKAQKPPVRQVVFQGEPFTALNLLRMRDKLIPRPSLPT
jgi:Domain of unknown function (DUF4365)